jgi:hypothetical protein
MWGNSEGGWIWCKYHVYMYENGKMIPVETIPGMGGEGNEGKWWRGWILVQHTNSSMTHLIYYKNVCKCQNVLNPAQQEKIIETWNRSKILCL